MRDKCKLICLMCIIFILTLSGCGGAENAGVEGGVKKRSTVNWERGFQKGTLYIDFRRYYLDDRSEYYLE